MLSLEQLQVVYARCTDAGAPEFYKKLFSTGKGEGSRTISSWDEWKALPYLTKDIISATPFEERLFTARNEIDHVRATSGTSGKAPLFCPRTNLRHMLYRAEYHDFRGAGLTYVVPATPHWHESFQELLGVAPRILVFDPAHPKASVRLARAWGVDHISLFTFQMPAVIECMEQEGMGSQIRFIEICGQACSRALFERMRIVFPNATIIPFYGSSEVEDSPIGVPCRPITGEEPLAVYHAKESQHHELIDPETELVIDPETGAEGELVITAYPGEPSAFPLLRYRTGDMIRVTGYCEKHHAWTFTVLGRREMDFVKIPGGILRADEIERVLRLFPNEVTDRFEMHCAEKQGPHGPVLCPTLHIEVVGTQSPEEMADKISKNLRVAPNFTYADGVKKGRYLALTCTRLSLKSGVKTKRIVHG